MRFADPFADRYDDALPADHRAQAQADRDRDLHPDGNEVRDLVEQLAIVADLFVGGGVGDHVLRLQLRQRRAHQVRLAAQLLARVTRQRGQRRHVGGRLLERHVSSRSAQPRSVRGGLPPALRWAESLASGSAFESGGMPPVLATTARAPRNAVGTFLSMITCVVCSPT
jgi:hypothetical protein